MHTLKLQPPLPPRRSRPRRAYSLIEVLVVVLIIQVISSMVIVNVSTVQSSERLTRAAERVIVAARYARMLAMATGKNAGVEFDTSANTIRVFSTVQSTDANGNPVTTYPTVPNTFISGGSYVINLNTDNDISGVKMSNALIAGDSASPYQVTYGILGGTVNNGTIDLSYGTHKSTLKIQAVGDIVTQ